MMKPNLPERPPAALVAVARIQAYSPGATIFDQGASGDTGYVVMSGKVKVAQSTRRGSVQLLALLGPGEVVGELSLFDGGPRSASAQAVGPVVLSTFDRSVVTEVMGTSSAAEAWLIRQLAHRLRRAVEATSLLAFADAPTRLAALLVDLARRFGMPIGHDIVVEHGLTQVELAQLAGMTRESVNKGLSSFAARGWISVSKGCIYILDEPALTRRAGRNPVASTPVVISPSPPLPGRPLTPRVNERTNR